MDCTYTEWIFHGEELAVNLDPYTDYNDQVSDADTDVMQDTGYNNNDELPEMIQEMRDAANSHIGESEGGIRKFDRMLSEIQCELNPGCSKSLLSFLVQFLHLKVMNHLSNKGFQMFLDFFKEFLPDSEKLPSSLHEAKKLLRDLGLGYVPIHACKYDCALFWKEHEFDDECPVCKESRWKIYDGKGKKIPHKILRYFPLKSRLQRLFMSSKTALDMRWHKEKRVDDEDIMRHPADGEAWKDFDREYPEFAQDSRNVRLGLATDGFNPFGNMSNSYSMWPVILVPYNLPPWKCMKEPFFMLTLLIPGPQAPGKDIDVYLQPLIDELKELWEIGFPTYDVVSKEIFQLHAAVLWTINDFPAYANLSGWSTKGYKACPNCNKDTCSTLLGDKICYMGHRRYLPENHRWHRMAKKFDGTKELRPKPSDFSGDDKLQQLENLNPVKFGKHPSNRSRKCKRGEHNWVKKSILFDLPYWHKLKLRHNLDVIHIEKNICDNLLGTLLDIDGKTKDTDKARLDLEDMGIRKELHIKKDGEKQLKPRASYTLSPKEVEGFCEFLKYINYPDGYAANISRCVNIRGGKVFGLKTHDCHVLLQRILPIGIRGYLDKETCETLFELGNFFQQLCSKTLRLSVLETLEKDIPLILCKLEQKFPPAFFDVMVHLAVHLLREARLGGPVQYRWMFPFERNLDTHKHSVTNKARPEGSIAEAYNANECLTFISMYLSGVETKFNRQERNYDGGENGNKKTFSVFSQNVRPFGVVSCNEELSDEDFSLVSWCILNNCSQVEEYLTIHKGMLEVNGGPDISQSQSKVFSNWFYEHKKSKFVSRPQDVSEDLWSLDNGPDRRVNIYSSCIVNGVRFHTRDRDSRRKTQNSGLVVEGIHGEKSFEYYGILTKMIELSYILDRKVILFQCEWFDLTSKRTIQVDKYVTSINVNRHQHQDDPFVLCTQAKQVYYVNDTKLGRNWQVVQHMQHSYIWDVPESEDEDRDDYSFVPEEIFQNESMDIGVTSRIDEHDVNSPLNRDGIDPDVIVINTTRANIEANSGDVDNSSDVDEDETLANYCDYENGEEENIDIDSDIDT